MTPSPWPLWDNTPPDRLTLKRGELHLWRIPLGLSPEKTAELKKILSQDEIVRADRLLDPAKRENFIASRGSLRLILGRYLNLEPGEIPFEYGEEGKPFIETALRKDIYFNLSHSDHWAALAVAAGMEVGIDIEFTDPLLDCGKVAAQFFSLQERDKLTHFSARRRRRGFYRIWTAKEAGLKCSGTGFSQKEIGIDEENTIPFGSSKNTFETVTFHLAKNYVATIVLDGDLSSLKRWHLSW